MVMRNRKWALFDVIYRVALESIEKEGKLFLRPEMKIEKGLPFPIGINLLVQGKSEICWCPLSTSKDGAQEP